MTAHQEVSIIQIRPADRSTVAVYLGLRGATLELVAPRVSDRIIEVLELLLEELAHIGMRVSFQSGTAVLLRAEVSTAHVAALYTTTSAICDELRERVTRPFAQSEVSMVLSTHLGDAGELMALEDDSRPTLNLQDMTRTLS